MESLVHNLVRSPKAVFEVIDDEVIIISQDTGIYYSLREGAAIVWQLVDCGLSAAEVVDCLAGGVERADQASERPRLTDFLGQLQAEGLLVPAPEPAPRRDADVGALVAQFRAVPGLSLLMERFDNMQDYLNVDPIHDVDDLGWPHTVDEAPDNG